MIACTEFYSNSCKILAKFPLCITNLLRLIQTSLLLSLASWLRVFVQPRKNTNKQTDVSVQHTGKWIERITQSERALPWGYFIINTIASILRGDTLYNNLHLARKYAWTSVRGHYLFRKANSFSRAKLEENCELWGTDKCPRTNIRAYFQSQMQAIVFIILQIFFAAPGICHFVIYQSHQRLSIGFQNPYVFNSFSILRPLNMPRFSWMSMLLKSAIFKCKEMRLFQFRERQYICTRYEYFYSLTFFREQDHRFQISV